MFSVGKKNGQNQYPKYFKGHYKLVRKNYKLKDKNGHRIWPFNQEKNWKQRI